MYRLKKLADNAGHCLFLAFGQNSTTDHLVEQIQRFLIAAFRKGGIGFNNIFFSRRTFKTGSQLGCRVSLRLRLLTAT